MRHLIVLCASGILLLALTVDPEPAGTTGALAVSAPSHAASRGPVRLHHGPLQAPGGWHSQSTSTLSDLNSIACPSTTTCYAVANNGTILVTTNAGAAWRSQHSGIDKE